MSDILIRRNGNVVEISGPNGAELPRDLVCRMHAKFKYSLREPTFVNRKVTFTISEVYLLIDTPRKTLMTSYGMYPSVSRWLTEQGLKVMHLECTAPENNPNLLVPDRSVLDRYKFREGQLDCIEAFIRKRHGIIDAHMGFGKTFILSVLIQLYPTAKFHICTRSRDIVQEIFNRLQTVTPNVGIYCGDAKITGKRVMVITANSLGAIDSDADFLIFDECHQAAAHTYSQAIVEKYPFSRNYGFSATPVGRSDGADAALTFLFGDVIYHMPYEDGVERGLVVPIQVEWLTCLASDGNSGYWSSKVMQFRNLIWRNEHRNSLIANYVKDRCDKDSRVLILVASIEHAVYLRQYLPDFELVYGSLKKEDLEYYQRMDLLPADYKPLKPKDRKEMQQRFKSGEIKRVIATDVWNTGVDFPDLTTVINASGRSSVITTTQGGGRVSRIASGKSSATVVDIIDAFDGTASSFYRGSISRKKTYTEQGWEQHGWPESKRKTV